MTRSPPDLCGIYRITVDRVTVLIPRAIGKVVKVYSDRAFTSVNLKLESGKKKEILYDPSSGIEIPVVGSEIYVELDCANTVTKSCPLSEASRQDIEAARNPKEARESKRSKDTCKEIERLLANGQTERAIESAKELSRAEPENPKAWFILGKSLANAMEFEAASESFRSALKYDPCYHEAWNELGLVYYRLGLRAEAEKAFSQAAVAGAKLGYYVKDFTLEQYLSHRIGFNIGCEISCPLYIGIILGTYWVMTPLLSSGAIDSVTHMAVALIAGAIISLILFLVCYTRNYRTELFSHFVPWEITKETSRDPRHHKRVELD